MRMSSDEFAHYMVYDRMNPISDERADYRAALIAWKIGQLMGEELNVEDYLLQFGRDIKEENVKRQDEKIKTAETGLDYFMAKHNASIGA